MRKGKGLKFLVKAALRDPDGITTRLVEGKSERARDDARLRVQSRNGYDASTVLIPILIEFALPTASVKQCFLMIRNCQRILPYSGDAVRKENNILTRYSTF